MRQSARRGYIGHWYVVAVTMLAGAINAGIGAWAFFAPPGFYDAIATFPPYNLHFTHDVGAFQLGIGAALLGALVWRDSLFVALAGATVATGFHWVSHVIDRDLGGNSSDPWTLGVLAGLMLVGSVVRFRARTGEAAGKADEHADAR